MISFTPPTHEESIQTSVKPVRYYRYTWANSIVRINGVLTSVRSPSGDLLTGEPGVDYFLGGHEYLVSDEIADELTLGGFIQTVGYGLRPYGYGPYGS